MTASDRLLTFEIDGTIYALPIHGVLEVAEAGPVACVPTLPPDAAGVVNWHGDALPVVAPHRVLDRDERRRTDDAAPHGLESEHVVVVSDRSGESAQLGIPIDRVLGLVDGSIQRAKADGALVVERRRVRGRVVNVLDPAQWVARAKNVIENAAL